MTKEIYELQFQLADADAEIARLIKENLALRHIIKKRSGWDDGRLNLELEMYLKPKPSQDIAPSF